MSYEEAPRHVVVEPTAVVQDDETGLCLVRVPREYVEQVRADERRRLAESIREMKKWGEEPHSPSDLVLRSSVLAALGVEVK